LAAGLSLPAQSSNRPEIVFEEPAPIPPKIEVSRLAEAKKHESHLRLIIAFERILKKLDKIRGASAQSLEY
jgi:hypothetical protein